MATTSDYLRRLNQNRSHYQHVDSNRTTVDFASTTKQRATSGLDPIGDSVGLAAPYGQNNRATHTPILKRIWPTGPPLLNAEN